MGWLGGRARAGAAVLGRVLGCALVCVAACCGTGCATVFRGPVSQVSLTTRPAGAEVWIDGVYAGTTPHRAELVTADRHVVSLRLAGYTERTFALRSRIVWYWALLDVVATVWPVIVDAATEAWKELLPLDVTLERAPGASTSPAVAPAPVLAPALPLAPVRSDGSP